jgi:hypothetical protein
MAPWVQSLIKKIPDYGIRNIIACFKKVSYNPACSNKPLCVFINYFSNIILILSFNLQAAITVFLAKFYKALPTNTTLTTLVA